MKAALKGGIFKKGIGKLFSELAALSGETVQIVETEIHPVWGKGYKISNFPGIWIEESCFECFVDNKAEHTLTVEELDLIRQWHNAVDDVAPEYLDGKDEELGKKITEWCGHRWRGQGWRKGDDG